MVPARGFVGEPSISSVTATGVPATNNPVPRRQTPDERSDPRGGCMETSLTQVLARVEREKEAYLRELEDYIRIPSISTDPEYKGEVVRCADWLLAKMRSAGLTAEKIETGGNPLVYGEWLGAPGKPTILFYGHYDVQPAVPLELWRHPPFEPTLEGDCLVARGATDDKGQSYTHLKAVAAWLAETGSLPVNVKFIVEGEEESGGEAIEAFVRTDAGRRLAADAVVISDSSMHGPDLPALCYGLRGLVYTEIRVTGPDRDLHSGTYGGAVSNPLNALAQIIARLRDPETGKVLVPGFYDDVRPLGEQERRELNALPFDEADYARDLGVDALPGEQGYSVIERTGARPTCDVNGIFGGYQGAGAKTIIASWGGAKISMRLVPDQDPKKIIASFTDYVRRVAPPGVKVDIVFAHGSPGVLVDLSGPIVEAAMDAMAEVWGNRPVRLREGGSIPIVGTFSQVLGVPVLLLGFGLADDRLHSPNEKFNVSHFYGGIRSVATLLDKVGRAPRP
jgi:acetylornithine deacetylase/succinyl-diaminopimelate desuccinylase-like protein